MYDLEGGLALLLLFRFAAWGNRLWGIENSTKDGCLQSAFAARLLTFFLYQLSAVNESTQLLCGVRYAVFFSSSYVLILSCFLQSSLSAISCHVLCLNTGLAIIRTEMLSDRLDTGFSSYHDW